MEEGQRDGLIIARVYTNLAGVYRAQSAYDQAETALNHALGILEQKSDANHPNRANTLTVLGSTQFLKGEYSQAATSLQQALQIYEQSLGLRHPRVAEALNHLSNVYRATGKIAQAIETRRTASAIREESLRRNFILGSERQKLDFLQQYARETTETIALHTQFAPKIPAALEMAFTVCLQRKGRVLDEMHQSIGALREAAGPETSAMFERYAEQRRLVAQLVTSGAREPKKIENLWQEIDQLAAAISERSAPFRTQTQPITLAAVKDSLPAHSALVEFVHYQPVATGKETQPKAQYAAYIMLADGTLRWAPLGNAEEIDFLIKVWRNAIDPKRKSPKGQSPADANKLARQVDALVMQPVRAQLGGIRQVFLAPDGDLNLLPFAALRDERGQYLIKDYLFIHVTSGRDLLRLKIKHPSQPDKLILAISNFDRLTKQPVVAPMVASPAEIASHSRSGVLSGDSAMSTLRFPRLDSAIAEGEAIQRLFPQSKLYTDAQATETLLKQVHRPYFLHLATHGFFLPNSDQNKENSLLRSGLALAGANQRQSGNDDGLLTAFEAAALDLWGTKLVVLSACETGNGEVKNGEGVFGLRRALVLAGAETQVCGLWRADDQATQKLMQSFYANLNMKMGRAEALRWAQLKMLSGGVHPTPYYWANFICLGEWKALDQ